MSDTSNDPCSSVPGIWRIGYVIQIVVFLAPFIGLVFYGIRKSRQPIRTAFGASLSDEEISNAEFTSRSRLFGAFSLSCKKLQGQPHISTCRNRCVTGYIVLGISQAFLLLWLTLVVACDREVPSSTSTDATRMIMWIWYLFLGFGCVALFAVKSSGKWHLLRHEHSRFLFDAVEKIICFETWSDHGVFYWTLIIGTFPLWLISWPIVMLLVWVLDRIRGRHNHRYNSSWEWYRKGQYFSRFCPLWKPKPIVIKLNPETNVQVQVESGPTLLCLFSVYVVTVEINEGATLVLNQTADDDGNEMEINDEEKKILQNLKEMEVYGAGEATPWLFDAMYQQRQSLTLNLPTQFQYLYTTDAEAAFCIANLLNRTLQQGHAITTNQEQELKV